MIKDDCIFCQIVNKTTAAHVVWEDNKFLAFLSIYPNTLGVTVVIPKKHYSSYLFAMEDNLIAELMIATKKVATLLDNKLQTKRCALVFEGMGVNHLHAKLYPLHGLKDVWEYMGPDKKISEKYFINYEGYISSHDCDRASEEDLAKIIEVIRN